MQTKNVLVTGGARRIGEAIARTLAAAGWNVVLHANRSQAQARSLGFPVAAPYSFDRFDAPAKCFAQALELAGGTLDAVVNNAAIYPSPTDATTDCLHVNTLAPIRFCKLLAGHLARRNAQGCAVNLLDARENGSPSYVRSKRLLAEYTRRACANLAPHLRVNGVAPGPVLAPELFHEKAGHLPFGTRPTPEAIARCVLFLLEENTLAGQILQADCGQHLS